MIGAKKYCSAATEGLKIVYLKRLHVLVIDIVKY